MQSGPAEDVFLVHLLKLVSINRMHKGELMDFAVELEIRDSGAFKATGCPRDMAELLHERQEGVVIPPRFRYQFFQVMAV